MILAIINLALWLFLLAMSIGAALQKEFGWWAVIFAVSFIPLLSAIELITTNIASAGF